MALADEALCIGPRQNYESYLNIERILTAAEISKADAVHPGYGFLSETPEFSRRCEENGITFIGPTSKIMQKMGDKAEARRTMKEAGVPVIPGSQGSH